MNIRHSNDIYQTETTAATQNHNSHTEIYNNHIVKIRQHYHSGHIETREATQNPHQPDIFIE